MRKTLNLSGFEEFLKDYKQKKEKRRNGICFKVFIAHMIKMNT